MIVLETFLSRFKLYKSDIINFENNNRKYYIKYETIKKKLNDYEIFALIDKYSDIDKQSFLRHYLIFLIYLKVLMKITLFKI